MNARAIPSARPLGGTAVEHGGVLIGFLIERRHGFDAVTATGQALGRFNTQDAAVRALLPKMTSVGCDG